MKDILTGYFTDYEPESCFVAESDNTVVGYLLGCRDSRVFERAMVMSFIPRFIPCLLRSRALLRRKNLIFGLHMLSSVIRGELLSPDFSREYPATLHINIREGFRRCGAGSQLMAEFLAYLKGLGVSGVRMATYSKDAGAFFEKCGFVLIFQK